MPAALEKSAGFFYFSSREVEETKNWFATNAANEIQLGGSNALTLLVSERRCRQSHTCRIYAAGFDCSPGHWQSSRTDGINRFGAVYQLSGSGPASIGDGESGAPMLGLFRFVEQRNGKVFHRYRRPAGGIDKQFVTA